MEGPDFTSKIGSEQATLRSGLITLGSSESQSTLQWGKFRVSFKRNPFRNFENLDGLLERLTRVIDFACSAGHEYTALLAYLCVDKIISNEVLQIVEGVRILGHPTFTTVILQALTIPRQNVRQGIEGIRQLVPALSDDRICGLREQMKPYVVDRISNYVRELQNTLLTQLGAGDQWMDAAMELLVFTHGLQEEVWLLNELDHSVQRSVRSIASGPSLMTVETLCVVRNSVRNATSSTPTPLQSQIDAYCKDLFILGCTIDP